MSTKDSLASLVRVHEVHPKSEVVVSVDLSFITTLSLTAVTDLQFRKRIERHRLRRHWTPMEAMVEVPDELFAVILHEQMDAVIEAGGFNDMLDKAVVMEVTRDDGVAVVDCAHCFPNTPGHIAGGHPCPYCNAPLPVALPTEKRTCIMHFFNEGLKAIVHIVCSEWPDATVARKRIARAGDLPADDEYNGAFDCVVLDGWPDVVREEEYGLYKWDGGAVEG